MIDFGKYTLHIWLSYGGTALLLGGLILQSVLAARAAKRALKEAEDER